MPLRHVPYTLNSTAGTVSLYQSSNTMFKFLTWQAMICVYLAAHLCLLTLLVTPYSFWKPVLWSCPGFTPDPAGLDEQLFSSLKNTGFL